MKKIYALVATLIFAGTLLTGCKTKSGSREFIPGRGWVPVSGTITNVPPLS